MEPGRVRTPPLSRRVVAIGALLLWSLAGVPPDLRAASAVVAPTAEQLQAALMIAFASYTTWPPTTFPSGSAPVVVGFIGNEALRQAFDATSRGRRVGGRSMVSERLQWDSALDTVHVLYLGAVEPRHVTALLQRVQRQPILTVSMLPEFVQAGGTIGLTSDAGRVSFAVNSRATTLSGLRLSSFLLSHATTVSSQ